MRMAGREQKREKRKGRTSVVKTGVNERGDKDQKHCCKESSIVARSHGPKKKRGIDTFRFVIKGSSGKKK